MAIQEGKNINVLISMVKSTTHKLKLLEKMII